MKFNFRDMAGTAGLLAVALGVVAFVVAVSKADTPYVLFIPLLIFGVLCAARFIDWSETENSELKEAV